MVYSKDESNTFNTDISHNNNTLKSFDYEANLLEDAVAQPVPNNNDRIVRNAAIALPLKYVKDFWRLLEMLLINCKVELKLKQKKHCILAAVGGDNTTSNPGNIIFTIKDTKLYDTVVTLSAKDNQKLSKLPNKGF